MEMLFYYLKLLVSFILCLGKDFHGLGTILLFVFINLFTLIDRFIKKLNLMPVYYLALELVDKIRDVNDIDKASEILLNALLLINEYLLLRSQILKHATQ